MGTLPNVNPGAVFYSPTAQSGLQQLANIDGAGGVYANTAAPATKTAASTTTPANPYTPTSTSSTLDPSTGLSYDYETNQANSQLGNLGQQQSVGLQNILDAYNTSYNALTGSKALADRDYNTNSATTLNNYVTSRGNQQAQVGQQANSLQRLLGARGYNGSANIAAAYAAAQQGTQANNSLQNQYATNQQSLDTNYGDYNNQYNTQLNSLGQQKTQQQNSLQAQVDSTKQGLLQQLAQISAARGGSATAYQPQIDQLGQQITSLGQNYANPVIQATPPTYQAPSLASYDAPTQTAASYGNNAAAANVNPYLSVLLGQQNKNLNNIG